MRGKMLWYFATLKLPHVALRLFLLKFLIKIFHFIAPQGYLIKLDFRDYFLIEPSEDCKFDMLEVSPVWLHN